MIKLAYCTFGLTNLDLAAAIEAIDKAGYEGIELCFHRRQFNPFEWTDEDLARIRNQLKTTRVKPACVATASYFFLPSRPHEPSLMSLDLAGRKRRIDLVKRGIEIARKLGVPLVTFGSGFLREEHVQNPRINPRELLVDSIRQCLTAINAEEDMTLLIEPEPGMFIETLEQGIGLVDEINSPKFKLHLDLCHIYCTEPDYVGALATAAPYARHLHVSDAQEGYNLKIIESSDETVPDLNFASYLVYFPEEAEYLLLDEHNPIFFYDDPVTRERQQRVQDMVSRAGITKAVKEVDYSSLYAGATEFDDEILTYLVSVPRHSFDVLERAKPIISYLRSTKDPAGKPLVSKRVANTLTGIVHYHDIPGEGNLDFRACFDALNAGGFSGFASVELYHHIAAWEKALKDSFKHLSQFSE